MDAGQQEDQEQRLQQDREGASRVGGKRGKSIQEHTSGPEGRPERGVERSASERGRKTEGGRIAEGRVEEARRQHKIRY